MRADCFPGGSLGGWRDTHFSWSTVWAMEDSSVQDGLTLLKLVRLHPSHRPCCDCAARAEPLHRLLGLYSQYMSPSMSEQSREPENQKLVCSKWEANRRIWVTRLCVSMWRGYYRGLEWVFPECATRAWRLFQAENHEGPNDSGRSFDPPPTCPVEFR